MLNHRQVLRSTVTGVLMLGLASSYICAQPESDRAAVREHDEPNVREQIRERIADRLKRARTMVERLEKALEKIDHGERPDPAILRDLERPWSGDPGERGMDSPRGGEARELPFDAPSGRDRVQDQPSLEEMRAFVEKEVPWLATRLKRAEAEHPGSSEAMLRRAKPRIAEVMHRAKEDPAAAKVLVEQFRLGADMVDASRRIRRAMTAGEMTPDEARSAFRKLAARHLEIREQLTRREIEHAHRRLQELEADLAANRERRGAILDEMAERMFERASHGDRPGGRVRDGGAQDRPRDGGSRRP